jgi:hypothetical protein
MRYGGIFLLFYSLRSECYTLAFVAPVLLFSVRISQEIDNPQSR